MTKKRTQLNINIDPELLIKLKEEAMKNGQTLTEFVTQQLNDFPTSNKKDALEERLLMIENHLGLHEDPTSNRTEIGTIFTNNGAKKYGEVAKALFDLHCNKKRVSHETGLEELAVILKRYPDSRPELVFQILLGNHDLTGLEMTKAYRNGSCAMRSALSDWCNDSLEELNEAFLNAVIAKSLR